MEREEKIEYLNEFIKKALAFINENESEPGVGLFNQRYKEINLFKNYSAILLNGNILQFGVFTKFVGDRISEDVNRYLFHLNMKNELTLLRSLVQGKYIYSDGTVNCFESVDNKALNVLAIDHPDIIKEYIRKSAEILTIASDNAFAFDMSEIMVPVEEKSVTKTLVPNK